MNRLIGIILVFVLAFGWSCAPKPPLERPKPKPETRPAPVTLGAPEEEETPERAASNALVEEGKTAFERGSLDRAGDVFQEAVSVDPTHGVPYYYLALVKMKSGEYGGVWGFLEKAEDLLARKPEWTAKLKSLREELEHEKQD